MFALDFNYSKNSCFSIDKRTTNAQNIKQSDYMLCAQNLTYLNIVICCVLESTNLFYYLPATNKVKISA